MAKEKAPVPADKVVDQIYKQAPAGIFTSTVDTKPDYSENARVRTIIENLDYYTVSANSTNQASDVKKATERLVKAIELLLSLDSNMVSYVLDAFMERMREFSGKKETRKNAFRGEQPFMYLPEVEHDGALFDNYVRLINMFSMYANNSRDVFHHMCDVEYSVNLIAKPAVRSQIAAYFNR